MSAPLLLLAARLQPEVVKRVKLQNLLWNAVWLTLEAGYQTGDNMYSTIWDGPVIQVLFNRENVTDLVIEFNCVSTLAFLEDQFVSFSQGPLESP